MSTNSAVAYEALETLLSDRQPQLSPQNQRAARYLLNNPDDVAVSSMREIAKRAGVPPATLVRLATSVGFDSYVDIKDVFVRRITRKPTFSSRAQELQARKSPKADGPVENLVEAHLDSVQGILDRNRPDRIADFAENMLDAQQVFFFGARSSFSPAYQFFYLHRMFRSNGVLINDPGGARGDMLRTLKPKDAFFLASFAPYAVESVRSAQYAKAAGAKVFAITDNAVSPIGALADHMLIAPTTSNSFFPSLVGVTALIESVLAYQVIKLGKSAVRELNATENRLKEIDAYWSE